MATWRNSTPLPYVCQGLGLRVKALRFKVHAYFYDLTILQLGKYSLSGDEGVIIGERAVVLATR